MSLDIPKFNHGVLGRPTRAHFRAKISALAVAACFANGVAQANPANPVVTNGAASFTQVGNLLQVTNTPNAIINWNSFSIGASEITRFIQQSSASAVLNRVGAGGNPSSILGALQSNGRVFLINPNGITFGAGSQVNVGGLVASTLNLSDADFLAGRMRFTGGALANAGNSVINNGNITTGSGGSVYLIGNAVTNNGIITSPKGDVILAAGNSVELVNPGTPDLRVEITAPDNQAINLGDIVANSGRIGIYAGLINHSGTINANSVDVDAAGNITLRATNNVDLASTSRITASGTQGGTIGIDAGAGAFLAGMVEAKGRTAGGGSVRVNSTTTISNAAIDVSGASGGSMALMSTRNYMGGGSLKADGSAGAGGNIAIKADRVLQTSSEMLSATGAGGSGGNIGVTGVDRVVTSASLVAGSDTHAGGDVRVLGKDIFLLGANADASGAGGGGSILIGGDFQGKNPNVLNAHTASVNFSSTLKADATGAGDGGKIIVWSDTQTRYAGNASARGGAQSGDGGFIEISGKDTLAFGGTANASAAHGKAGTLLLDPKNIVIDAAAGGAGTFELVNPHPATSGFFPGNIPVLGNSNVVVTNPNAFITFGGEGAAYLYNGSTGAIISTIAGSSLNEGVGGNFTSLSGNNFLLVNPFWKTNVGAVTWGSGTTGFIGGGGVLSSANSLVGASGDLVGSGGITVHGVTGNFAVTSPEWSSGFGAVTLGSGVSGVTGNVNAANSLVGNASGDRVGGSGTVQLGNADFLVLSPEWGSGGVVNQGIGAVTFVSGSGTTVGAVSSSNSLVGSTAGDRVGSNLLFTATGGHFAVASPDWSGGRGAVTYSLSGTGITGSVSNTNSLVGTTAGDRVGSGGIMGLSGGGDLIFSPEWTNGGAATNAGAVTFVDPSAGISGLVTTPGNNSVWGTGTNDGVGAGGSAAVTSLASGHFALRSPEWNAARGAVTFVDKTNGFEIALSTPGAISSANSLVGSTAGDRVGSTLFGDNAVVPLVNSQGNYAVASSQWNGQRGAVTLVDGTTGIPLGESTPGAVVSSANSLTGAQPGDQVGSGVTAISSFGGVKALANGNYAVLSPNWSNGGNNGAGAVTVVDGLTGVAANETVPGVVVSATNSLVGTQLADFVGSGAVVEPALGKLVVSSPNWANGAASNAGAVTLMGSTPATAVVGAISNANSLVGTGSGDQVGAFVEALGSDKYIVRSPFWNNVTAAEAGAVTLVDGISGFATNESTIGAAVSSSNSLVGGNAFDQVGSQATLILPNGNFLIRSPQWNNNGISTLTAMGAITFGTPAGTFSDGSAFAGVLSSANSLVGGTAGDRIGSSSFGAVNQLISGNFLVRSPNWSNGNGALTLGTSLGKFSDGSDFKGTVSVANSLVGSTAGDRVGDDVVHELYDNGNWSFVVGTPAWNAGRGAATFGKFDGTLADGSFFKGAISASNSLIGTAPNEFVGASIREIINNTSWNFLVSTGNWNSNTGAVTFGTVNGKFVDGTPFAGNISSSNSLVGSAPGDNLGLGFTYLFNGPTWNYLVQSPNWNGNAGAVTFGTSDGKFSNGTAFKGVLSVSNSLIGTQAGDAVGSGGTTILNDGSYAVISPNWSNGATANVGAVTLGSGTTGVAGAVTASNSLIGFFAGDQFGSGGVQAYSTNSALVLNPNAHDALGGSPNSGRLFVLSPGFAGALPPMGFADNALGTSTISPSQITAITNTGTAVVLQANNDITQVAGSNIVTSAGGTGGALTLQAGRSITLNANITTDNGNLTLVANDNAASGVAGVNRDAGAANITMATGTTLNAGTGTIAITMNDGAGIGAAQSGNITLSNLTTSGQILIEDKGASTGNSITQLAGSTIAANQLQVVGGNSQVILDSLANEVNTVAGSSKGGDFVFKNNRLFTIDRVGIATGVQVDDTNNVLSSGSRLYLESNSTVEIWAPVQATSATSTAAINIEGNGGNGIFVSGAAAVTASGFGSTSVTMKAPTAFIVADSNLSAISSDGAALVDLSAGSGGLTLIAPILSEGLASADLKISTSGPLFATGTIPASTEGTLTAQSAGGNATVMVDAAAGLSINASVSAKVLSPSNGDATVSLTSSLGGAIVTSGKTVLADAGTFGLGTAAVTIQAAGNVQMDGNVTALSGGSFAPVTIEATNGWIRGAGVVTSLPDNTGVISLTAAQGIGQLGAPIRTAENIVGVTLIATNTGPTGDIALSTTTGNFTLANLTNITNANLTGAYELAAENGNVVVTSPVIASLPTQNIWLKAPNGNIAINSTGPIGVATSAAPALTDGYVRLEANQVSVGVNTSVRGGRVEIRADDVVLNANPGSSIITNEDVAAGKFSFVQTFTAGRPIELGTVGSPGGALALDYAELGQITTNDLRIGTVAGGGALTFTQPMAAVIPAMDKILVAGSTVTQSAGAALRGTVRAAAGAGGILLTDPANLVDVFHGKTVNAAITLINNNPAGLAIGQVTSAGGNIVLQNSGDITFATDTVPVKVDAGAGTATITSAAGAIVDAFTLAPDVVAGTVTLSGVTGVGSIADPIETRAGTLNISGGGAIGVSNTGGVTVGSLNVIGAATAANIASDTAIALVGSTINSNAATSFIAPNVQVGGITSGGGNISVSNAGGNLTITGLLSAPANTVTLSASGQIIDANAGVDIIASQASLTAAGGIASVAAPLQTQIATLSAVNSGGEIGISNTGNLALGGPNFTGSNAQIGTSGAMTLAGGPAVASTGNITLKAGAGLNINRTLATAGNLTLDAGAGNLTIGDATAQGAAVTATGANLLVGSAGGIQPSLLASTGAMNLSTPGTITVQGGGVSLASADVNSGGLLTLATGGDVIVRGGAGAGAFGRMIGNPDLRMASVGGFVRMDAGTGLGANATIESVAPNSIYIFFPNLFSGGYFVNGVESAVFSGLSGFFAGGFPAILDTNLIITYGLGSLLPSFQSNTLIAATDPNILIEDKDVFSQTEDELRDIFKGSGVPQCN